MALTSEIYAASSGEPMVQPSSWSAQLATSARMASALGSTSNSVALRQPSVCQTNPSSCGFATVAMRCALFTHEEPSHWHSILGWIDRLIRSNSRAASQAFPRFANYDKSAAFRSSTRHNTHRLSCMRTLRVRRPRDME